MEKKIFVILDKNYGREVVRPASENAHLFCELAGTKTFTQQAINTLKKLGYQFEVLGLASKEFQF